MYQYSHRQADSFVGLFRTPQEALLAGREQFGDDVTVFVAVTRPMSYKDLLPSAEILLADMSEKAASMGNDNATIAIDSLNAHQRSSMIKALEQSMLDWEVHLKKEARLDGRMPAAVVKYVEGTSVGKEWDGLSKRNK